jgi:hypothetical protein
MRHLPIGVLPGMMMWVMGEWIWGPEEVHHLVTRHKMCGGIVEWTDTSDIDEDYVCQKCGAVVDGEDMETVRVES